MELAVNMPEHEPQVGQLSCSSWASSSSLMSPFWWRPTASNTLARSTLLPPGSLPAFIGPPDTNTVGMLIRSAPISIPGTILSQFDMHTRPSSQWACAMVSTESAISSRDGSE